MAAGILARVPRGARYTQQEVVVTACIGLGFTIDHPRGHRIFAIEIGNGALVDGLPGVPVDRRYVGTFDREEAVENETIDFFASGHPLVEGIFAHFEESALGRVARFEMQIGRSEVKGSWPSTRTGRRSRSSQSIPRAGQAGLGGGDPSAAAPRARRARRAVEGPDWRAMVRRLGTQLEPARRPHAFAAIIVRPVA